MLEESGFVVRVQKILAVFDRGKPPHEPPFAFHVHKIFMRCSLIGGRESVSAQTDAAVFLAGRGFPNCPSAA